MCLVTQVFSDFTVIRAVCYDVSINGNLQEGKKILAWRGTEKAGGELWWRVGHNPTQTDYWKCLQKRLRFHWAGMMARLQHSPKSLGLLCSLSHIHLLQSLSFSAWVSVTLCSDQDSLQHLSAPAVSNDSISSSPVTLQKYSVHPAESHLLLTLSLPSSSSGFPSSGSLLILPLPTHSFSVHILEDIYEHETERVHLHHFWRRGNLHFLLQPSPVSILFLIELIQILVLVSCCSSFFRLKAMCHSLLLSLCLFLHLFLPPPPTQSLSPLPTPFSLLSVDVIVCAPQIACMCLCVHEGYFCFGVVTYVRCQPVSGLVPQIM